MSERVIHMRTMREGTGETDASVTEGPVAVAVDELVRHLTEHCGHVVRMGRRTWRLDGFLVRQEFEVDVTLAPDKFHPEPRTSTWDHVVTRESDAYGRTPENAQNALSRSNRRSVALGDAGELEGAQNGAREPCAQSNSGRHCQVVGPHETHDDNNGTTWYYPRYRTEVGE